MPNDTLHADSTSKKAVELPAAIHPEQSYSREVAAAFLGVSLATVDRLIKARRLPARKVSARRVGIRGRDILACGE